MLEVSEAFDCILQLLLVPFKNDILRQVSLQIFDLDNIVVIFPQAVGIVHVDCLADSLVHIWHGVVVSVLLVIELFFRLLHLDIVEGGLVILTFGIFFRFLVFLVFDRGCERLIYAQLMALFVLGLFHFINNFLIFTVLNTEVV